MDFWWHSAASKMENAKNGLTNRLACLKQFSAIETCCVATENIAIVKNKPLNAYSSRHLARMGPLAEQESVSLHL